MNPIQIFDFKDNNVRATIIDGEPWFVAADIARALEYRDATHALRYLDDDKGRLKWRTNRGMQEVTIINESGLYSLILRSRKPQAKAFKKWVRQL